MNHAIYVTETTVIDPNTQAPVDVSLYKDTESQGIFGVDSSYLLTLSDDDPVSNPFNGKDIRLIDSAASSVFYYADICYKDDRTDLGGLIFCSLDSLPDDSPYQEEDVFYFGMGPNEALLSIGKASACNDFIITGVQLIHENNIMFIETLVDKQAANFFHETRLLTKETSHKFIVWYEKFIGSICDVSQHGNESYVVMCLDINERDRDLCKKFEDSLHNENVIEEMAWLEALKMVMSEIPDIETPVDVMMNHELEILPVGFIVWEPFENWDLMGIQGLVEEFKNSLLAHSKQVLKLVGVDNV